jgi:hypothetical protein
MEKELSIQKLYELYKETTDKPVQVFCTKFILGFHIAPKHQRQACEVYYQLIKNGSATKEKDKARACHEKKYHTITFDLQAVLSTPCGMVSQLYYKRKLSCYNLTVYCLVDKKGY